MEGTHIYQCYTYVVPFLQCITKWRDDDSTWWHLMFQELPLVDQDFIQLFTSNRICTLRKLKISPKFINGLSSTGTVSIETSAYNVHFSASAAVIVSSAIVLAPTWGNKFSKRLMECNIGWGPSGLRCGLNDPQLISWFHFLRCICWMKRTPAHCLASF